MAGADQADAPSGLPYYDRAKLLIAADCSAYAYAAFHQDFIRGHITLVGCPKLDGVDYAEKLTEILRNNDIRASTLSAWRCPAAAGWSWRPKSPSGQRKFIPGR